jgi:HEAT repeat protein
VTFFCPGCGTRIDPAEALCPACGFDLCAHLGDSYEQKLILALAHPIREHRMMAIQVLGELRSVAAAEPLKAILAAEDDYFVLREVLTSLARIDSDGCRAAVADAAVSHPSKLVRRFAARLLHP